MPIYAYLCGQCGFRKDVLQKLSDAPLTLCPHCGAQAFAKQLSAPSFQLKGTGWYATDFKNSGKPPGPAPSSGDAAPAAAPAADSGSSGGSSAAPAAPAAA